MPDKNSFSNLKKVLNPETYHGVSIAVLQCEQWIAVADCSVLPDSNTTIWTVEKKGQMIIVDNVDMNVDWICQAGRGAAVTSHHLQLQHTNGRCHL